MKKLFWVGLMIVVVVFLGYWALDRMARQTQYEVGDLVTKYRGGSQITMTTKEQALINPTEGVPFVVKPEEAGQYSTSDYETVSIPAQTQLVHAVGEVVGWEDIVGSLDKYLLLQHTDQAEAVRYRVAFEESALFGANTTALGIEKLGIPLIRRSTMNQIYKPKANHLLEMGYDGARRMIRRGDIVTVLPVWEPPELSKRDNQDNYLVGWLMIRRVR